MKRNLSLLSTVATIAMLSVAFLLTSCQKENLSSNSDKTSDVSSLQNNNNIAKSGAPLKVDLMHIYMDVEDAQMMPPTGNNTLLFDHAGHAPVLAPDGHAVPLGEFNMVSGWAHVKCINGGTHVVVHLAGLIPNGVYTLWIMTFQSNGTSDRLNGVGALGAPDGSQNVLKVNSDGTADLSVTTPAEPLSVFGAIPNCWSSVFKVMVAGAYHLDGQTHGESPGGADGFTAYVLQFGFPVMGSQL